jgi:hypothetical protein
MWRSSACATDTVTVAAGAGATGAAAAAVQVSAAARQLRSVLHVLSLWVQADRNWDDGSRGDCSPGCQHRSCCTNTGTVRNIWQLEQLQLVVVPCCDVFPPPSSGCLSAHPMPSSLAATAQGKLVAALLAATDTTDYLHLALCCAMVCCGLRLHIGWQHLDGQGRYSADWGLWCGCHPCCA